MVEAFVVNCAVAVAIVAWLAFRDRRHRKQTKCLLGITDNARGEWVHRADCPYCDGGGFVPPLSWWAQNRRDTMTAELPPVWRGYDAFCPVSDDPVRVVGDVEEGDLHYFCTSENCEWWWAP